MSTRIRTLALLLTLAATPAIAADGPDLPVEAYRVDNGLKVVLSRDPSVPRVTVAVAYHVGSKDERAGRTGFAHFFEHMMFRGTEHVPNYDIPLQEAGAGANAFTSEDMTVYFETVPSNFLERALYLEADRLAFLPSALDQEKFDTEREVVKNERRQSFENVPYGLADETILAHLYPAGHPYSWSVIGSMRDLDAATLDDLKAFFNEYYHVGNATLCLVGDFEIDAAKDRIAAYFGPLKPGPEPRRPEAPEAPAVDDRLVLKDDVQLPRVYWDWPTVAEDDPDAPALEALAAVLSMGEASRLYKALVLTEIATDAGASQLGQEIDGRFEVEATAAEGSTIEAIEAAIASEIDRIRAEEPTADELRRVIARNEVSVFTGLTSPLGRAITLATGMAQYNDPRNFIKEYKRFSKVTPADVRRAAETYLTAEHLTLEVRPVSAGEAESTAVVAGPSPTDEPSPSIEDRRPDSGAVDWSAMPGPSEPGPFTVPEVIRRSLDNGVAVWIVPRPELPLVDLRLILPFGTADDPEGKSGLARLVGSVMDQGTADLTATELAEQLGLLGASLRASVDTATSGLSLNVLSRNLGPALALMGDVLTEPRLDPADFERERQLQLADLLQGPDSPRWIAQRAFRILLYGADHPFGNPADGYAETVSALGPDDVRAFLERHARPDGATLIAVGDVEPDDLIAQLNEVFADWKATGAAPERATPDPESAAGPGVVYLIDKPGAAQSVLAVGRRWYDREDPRYVPALLGNRILGGDFLSRLNQNLRERNGFTYGARSYFRFLGDESVWAVSTDVRTDATAPALREVVNELDGLAGDRPFTTEEILTARDAELQSFPEQFESPRTILGVLVELAELGLPPEELTRYLEGLRSAREEMVREVMAEVVVPDRRLILVVGDRARVEPALREAGFQNVHLLTHDGEAAGE